MNYIKKKIVLMITMLFSVFNKGTLEPRDAQSIWSDIETLRVEAIQSRDNTKNLLNENSAEYGELIEQNKVALQVLKDKYEKAVVGTNELYNAKLVNNLKDREILEQEVKELTKLI